MSFRTLGLAVKFRSSCHYHFIITFIFNLFSITRKFLINKKIIKIDASFDSLADCQVIQISQLQFRIEELSLNVKTYNFTSFYSLSLKYLKYTTLIFL